MWVTSETIWTTSAAQHLIWHVHSGEIYRWAVHRAWHLQQERCKQLFRESIEALLALSADQIRFKCYKYLIEFFLLVIVVRIFAWAPVFRAHSWHPGISSSQSNGLFNESYKSSLQQSLSGWSQCTPQSSYLYLWSELLTRQPTASVLSLTEQEDFSPPSLSLISNFDVPF